MASHPGVGAQTKAIAWFIAGALPVAALTAPAGSWKWGFALTYLGTAFILQVLVRPKNHWLELFAHSLVLSGSAPIAVRPYFGMDLTAIEVVHVVAVLVTSIGLGYLLADRVRSLFRKPGAVSSAA